MATAETHADAPSRNFVFSRLGSLLGILPLGVWTVNHIWDNLAVFRGPQEWERSVTQYAHPVSQAVTLVLVFLPLLLHLVWGLRQMVAGRPNNIRYGNFDNWKFLLQRLSAIGVLFFLGAHVFLAFIKPRILQGHPEAFENISAFMHHHPPTLAVYLLGTLGVAYHLGNGISSFCMYWGLAIGRKSGKRISYLSMAFFVLMTAASWLIIWEMYKAGSAYPPPPDM